MRIGQQIHDMIQDGQIDELKALVPSLPSSSSPVLEYQCPRSGMTPLHKAVEARSFDAIKILMDNGASLQARASLYDDDTPLLLAKRLKVDPQIIAFLEDQTQGR